MSIVIHFGPAPIILHQSNSTPMIPATIDETHKSLAMGPGLENNSGFSIMSADDSSIDVSTTNLQMCIEKESEISTPQHAVGTCFGLPYQDHNYGAPPPPTPPCNSPHLSPVHVPTVVETETVSIVTTQNNEVHEVSVTRCICGFKHDDEYMICCDRCLVWQHVDCMGLDRSRMPENYLCEQCQPRRVDRHKAKLLQTKKKVVLPVKLVFAETSEESEEDRNNQNNDAAKGRLQRNSSRKRSEEERDVKVEQPPPKKMKPHPKHVKDRMEIKRSRLHRKTKSRLDSVYADEEAQDPWKCSMELQKRKTDVNNQHTEEVHHMDGVLRTPTEDPKFGKQLQAQLCRVVDNKKLVASCDLARDQMIIEFKGQFMSASLFHEKNPTFKYSHYPHVLFYKLRSNEELCVDATDCKTDAKYVRRSCTPNSDVHHFVFSNSLHLYILSVKEIKKDEEITIPFDSSFKDSTQELECACNSDKCCYAVHTKLPPSEPSERKRTRRRTQLSTDEDSNHSLGGSISSPTKSSKSGPAKPLTQKPSISPVMIVSESSESKAMSEDNDNIDVADKKKLTREERKLNAIMRAFDQMEKAAKRRQQALDRMASQKAGGSKLEDSPEKSDSSSTVTKDIKDDEQTTSAVETTSATEEEKTTTASVQTPKPKKGKRRRGSGTSTRKRTRTYSGGSDIFTTDDASAGESTPNVSTPIVVTHDTSESTSMSSMETTTSPIAQCAASIFPKTKRYLHHEWLQEKVELSPTIPIPLSAHAESNHSTSPAATTYIKCIKDSPTAGGISAAHMRRSSLVGHGKQTSGQGSAKKRWLRQAMYESEPWEGDMTSGDAINGDGSPVHACFSPNRQNDVGSPVVLAIDDVITPLKKRRLMRNSLESLPSPKSPNTESTGTSSCMSPDHSSCELNTETLSNGTCLSESIKHLELVSVPNSINFVGKCMPTGIGLGKHLLKSLRERWIEDDIKTKAESLSVETDVKSFEKTTDTLTEKIPDVECSSKSEHQPSACDTEISALKIEEAKAQVKDENSETSNEKNETEQNKDISIKTEEVSSVCNDNKSDTLEKVTDFFVNTPVIVSLPLCKISDSSSCEENVAPRDIPTQSNGSNTSSLVGNILERVEKVEQLSDGGETSNRICNTTLISMPESIDAILLTESAKEPCLSVVDKEDPVTKRENFEESVDSVEENVPVLSPSSVIKASDLSECNVHNSSGAQKDIQKDESTGSPVGSDKVVSSLVSRPQNNNEKLNVLDSEIVPTKEVENTTQKTPLQSGKEVSTPCGSATQRRKVSLSEYRQRKRDNPSAVTHNVDKTVSNNCILQELDLSESLKDGEIKLAALPLFEKPDAGKMDNPEECKLTNATVKSANETGNGLECHAGRNIEQRENLADRLKREFGFDDEHTPDKKDTTKHNSLLEQTPKAIVADVSPMLTLCPQYPSPSSTQISHINSNGSMAPQFGYPSIQQTSFVGAQMSSGLLMGSQSQTLISAIHPNAMQPTCAYGAAMHSSVPRPPFPPVASPSFSLPSRLPHMPLPASYPTSFQPRVYK